MTVNESVDLHKEMRNIKNDKYKKFSYVLNNLKVIAYLK